jgi:hypothetical protein
MHFRQGFVAVSKEHQSKLAQYQVKTAIGEWELLGGTGTPCNRETFSLGGCATHAEHVWIEVKADDCSPRSNAWYDVSGDDTCPTGHVEDTLAGLHIRRLDQVRCPGGE